MKRNTASSVTMAETLPAAVSGSVLEGLGAAVLGRVFHGDDDVLGAGDEVHRPAHARHHLARHHPVGEVAVLVDLQAAEHGGVDMAATG